MIGRGLRREESMKLPFSPFIFLNMNGISIRDRAVSNLAASDVAKAFLFCKSSLNVNRGNF
jgi:hypothetical protein